MSVRGIHLLGSPVLREAGPPVALVDDAVRQFVADLFETMEAARGVGLAANQVHEGLRVATAEVREDASALRKTPAVPLTFLVNPEIVERSEELVDGWEGCLSVPGFRGLVPRHAWVRVKALSRQGEPVDLKAEGYFARILQHECDHLDGKVYLDRMAGLRTLCFTEEFDRFGPPSSE